MPNAIWIPWKSSQGSSRRRGSLSSSSALSANVIVGSGNGKYSERRCSRVKETLLFTYRFRFEWNLGHGEVLAHWSNIQPDRRHQVPIELLTTCMSERLKCLLVPHCF